MTGCFCKMLFRALLILLLPVAAQATQPPSHVTDFFTGLHTLQADFRQEVTDGNNKPLQSSEGHMWIKRPGRFRWDYETPYRQQLVADGKRLWSYDEDLEQVTVQKAADVLTSTPAMLLSGEEPLEKVFNIEEAKADGNEQHVLLVPKSDDSNVTQSTWSFQERCWSVSRLMTNSVTQLYSASPGSSVTRRWMILFLFSLHLPALMSLEI